MRQEGIDLDGSLGYLLKEASTALRIAMEAVLRPLGMSVTHYSCLELLSQRPGLTNSQLARGAFVTRQSMNVLLHALERDGVVTRPAEALSGRAQPAELTVRGRRDLARATVAIKEVEDRMIGGLDATERSAVRRMLRSFIASLEDAPTRDDAASRDDLPSRDDARNRS